MKAEKLLTQIGEEQGRQDRRHEGGSVAALG